MRVALAAATCSTDAATNLRTIAQTAEEYSSWGCDLVVFGETFGQHFDVPTFNPTQDRAIAWEQQGPEISRIRQIAKRHRIRLGVGYFERDGDVFYSSYLVTDPVGATLAHYRRISAGWRTPEADPDIYRCGTAPVTFTVADKTCTVALCGDMYHHPEVFAAAQPQVLLWPLWVEWTTQQWHDEQLHAYAHTADSVYAATLCVNPSSERTAGMAAWFRRGRIKASELAEGPAALVADVL